MGKPEQTVKKSMGPQKSPISRIWISTYTFSYSQA